MTEIAYPLFKNNKLNFDTISFDPIYYRVNPIAPRYIPNEESVKEISRVILENLLEQKETGTSGATKFFNDTVEGLIGGLIWKLKSDYPQYCTLPHVIAIYQYLNTESLVAFLSSNSISKSMGNAFISGVASERQTAAVKSTLANAFKKISTQKIFMVLSKDEVPLDINNDNHCFINFSIFLFLIIFLLSITTFRLTILCDLLLNRKNNNSFIFFIFKIKNIINVLNLR